MLIRLLHLSVALAVLPGIYGNARAQQVLTLKEAVETAVANYGTIRAKNSYLESSRARVQQSVYETLPNLHVSVQSTYGTINGQNGPMYGFGGLGVASSGLPLPQQNWNSAFGALYLSNVNWEFFAFGRARDKVKAAQAAVLSEEADLEQEIFRHRVKVAGAYLNLLAAGRLKASYLKNFERAEAIRTIVHSKAKNGLIPGVDSSLANAEVANARMLLIRSQDFEQEQNNLLARLMGVPVRAFVPDTTFLNQLPAMPGAELTRKTDAHPLVKAHMGRIAVNEAQTRYLKTFYYPSFSLVGIFQTRGSGFSSQYASDQTAYTHNFFEGLRPVRSNYLLGVGATWNLTQPLRSGQQVKSQQWTGKGLQEELDLLNQQLIAQQELADTKMANAWAVFREAPRQTSAASEAYRQKSVQYQNGLTTLVEVSQALYSLIRAETDQAIAAGNVWQALLLRAAAAGDYGIFDNGR